MAASIGTSPKSRIDLIQTGSRDYFLMTTLGPLSQVAHRRVESSFLLATEGINVTVNHICIYKQSGHIIAWPGVG